MAKRHVWILAALVLALTLVACGGKKKPTPVPTLANVTVIPLTPTAASDQVDAPQLPKYLPPTREGQNQPPTSVAPPTQPALPTENVVTIEVSPTAVTPRVEVVVNMATGYNGPGEAFVPVGVAQAGEQLIVEERSPDGQWLHVCCFAGRPGWIALQNVRPLTDLDSVPVATSVPTASPLPTPTPEQ